MEAPYLEGVPYLSREEEAMARKIESSRRDKSFADIQIKGDDTETLDFLKRVRKEITTWKSRTTVSI